MRKARQDRKPGSPRRLLIPEAMAPVVIATRTILKNSTPDQRDSLIELFQHIIDVWEYYGEDTEEFSSYVVKPAVHFLR